MKIGRNLRKEPVFRMKFKKLNLELLRNNYSSYNRIYLFFKKVHSKTLNKLNQGLYFNRWAVLELHITSKSLPETYHKNTFKISKDIFTSKLKDNFLKFSMLLVKESKFMIYKSKNKALLEELFQFNKKQYYKILWFLRVSKISRIFCVLRDDL